MKIIMSWSKYRGYYILKYNYTSFEIFCSKGFSMGRFGSASSCMSYLDEFLSNPWNRNQDPIIKKLYG